MDAEAYIEQRVDEQIKWYDDKSQSSQARFKALRVIEVVCAALIPLIAGFQLANEWTALVVSLLGVVIAVSAALIGLGNYQENWVEYRTTCESLRHEKYLFMTKATPYDDAEPFNLFVQRVEGLVSKENSTWSQAVRSQKRSKGAGAAE